MRRRLHHVELTDNSVHVDGQDLSNRVASATLVLAAGQAPKLHLTLVPHVVAYTGAAELYARPVDGIDRLRQRLSRPTA